MLLLCLEGCHRAWKAQSHGWWRLQYLRWHGCVRSWTRYCQISLPTSNNVLNTACSQYSWCPDLWKKPCKNILPTDWQRVTFLFFLFWVFFHFVKNIIWCHLSKKAWDIILLRTFFSSIYFYCLRKYIHKEIKIISRLVYISCFQRLPYCVGGGFLWVGGCLMCLQLGKVDGVVYSSKFGLTLSRPVGRKVWPLQRTLLCQLGEVAVLNSDSFVLEFEFNRL